MYLVLEICNKSKNTLQKIRIGARETCCRHSLLRDTAARHLCRRWGVFQTAHFSSQRGTRSVRMNRGVHSVGALFVLIVAHTQVEVVHATTNEEALRKGYAASIVACGSKGYEGQLIRVKTKPADGSRAAPSVAVDTFTSLLQGFINATAALNDEYSTSGANKDAIGRQLEMVDALEANLGSTTLDKVFAAGDDVQEVEANCRVYAVDRQTSPIWGLDRIGMCARTHSFLPTALGAHASRTFASSIRASSCADSCFPSCDALPPVPALNQLYDYGDATGADTYVCKRNALTRPHSPTQTHALMAHVGRAVARLCCRDLIAPSECGRVLPPQSAGACFRFRVVRLTHRGAHEEHMYAVRGGWVSNGCGRPLCHTPWKVRVARACGIWLHLVCGTCVTSARVAHVCCLASLMCVAGVRCRVCDCARDRQYRRD